MKRKRKPVAVPLVKTRQQLEIENQLLRNRQTTETVASILNNLIRSGGAVAIAYFAIYRTVETLAGKMTYAHITMPIAPGAGDAAQAASWLAYLPWIGSVIPWLVMVACAAYAWRQRKLRRDTTERLHGRIEKLEKSLNPGRTSSTLTARGETREEDRL